MITTRRTSLLASLAVLTGSIAVVGLGSAAAGSIEPLHGSVPGYAVVSSGALPDPAGTQSSGSVSCPPGTKVLGGGATDASSSLSVELNSSWPDTTTSWSVNMNNGSASTSTFDVFAVCAKSLKNYKLKSNNFSVPVADSEFDGVQQCPSGTRVFGGGGFADSTDLGAVMEGSDGIQVPFRHLSTSSWVVGMTNSSPSTFSATVYAICAKVQKYHLVYGAWTDVPAGQQVSLSVPCPSPLVELGGGANIQPPGTLGSSDPTGSTGWESNVNNPGPRDVQARAVVTCGA